MQSQTTNPRIQSLIAQYESQKKRSDQPLWSRLAHALHAQHRQAEVSVEHIDTHAYENALVIVPGKVLGPGTLSKQVTVAALHFSAAAYDAVSLQGKALALEDLDEQQIRDAHVQLLQ